MKEAQIRRASVLLDRLAKMNAFLDNSPENADTITFTLRKGKISKSFSLNDAAAVNTFKQFFIKTRAEMIQELENLNVELDL